ncbi:MAG: Release factor glutamine methyltransferase [Gemmatimonadaceae bacterium]|nr:Release factor glutamine methyltransferase [Gemmatimonadaceae bacterium]
MSSSLARQVNAATGSVEPDATAGRLVAELAVRLERAGIAASRTEARDLVAAVCEAPRFWPVLEPTAALGEGVILAARIAAERRAAGAPFAYAVQRAAFRHLTLAVDERVLIPRPETEMLVDHVLAMVRGRADLHVLEIGTGSGAIAIALASEANFGRVVATDVSCGALDVARNNAARYARALCTPIEFRVGSMFAPVRNEQFDVLASNPPYIAFEEAPALPRSVRDWEPAEALMCGGDGLDITRQLIDLAPHHVRAGGVLAIEVDERRAERVARTVLDRGGWNAVRIHKDLAGRDRFVTACRANTSY